MTSWGPNIVASFSCVDKVLSLHEKKHPLRPVRHASMFRYLINAVLPWCKYHTMYHVQNIYCAQVSLLINVSHATHMNKFVYYEILCIYKFNCLCCTCYVRNELVVGLKWAPFPEIAWRRLVVWSNGQWLGLVVTSGCIHQQVAQNGQKNWLETLTGCQQCEKNLEATAELPSLRKTCTAELPTGHMFYSKLGQFG